MKIFGLFGFPLSHSFSGIYFNARFLALGLKNHRYELFPLKSLDHLVDFIRKKKNLAGFNVTIPHKINLLKYLDYVHPSAQKIGAVNSVKIKRTGNVIRLFGYNTDWFGFEKSLILFLNRFITSPVPSFLPTCKNYNFSKKYPIKALILGTGGAAKAVAFALSHLGFSYSYVSRKPKTKSTLSYRILTKKIIHEHRLIINATPLGMFPKINTYPPLPYKFITQNHLAFDLVYNPEQTKFLSKAFSQGAKIKNGFEMLVLQAEKTWEAWNN